MKLTYPACFYEDKKTKEYTVVVPDLEGCTTSGSNLSDAIEMAQDAASGWIVTSMENNEKIPEASEINNTKLDPDLIDGQSFVSILSLDISAYMEKYNSDRIEKTLTIPVWLNNFAEKRHLNFSKILQESLIKIYQKAKSYK